VIGDFNAKVGKGKDMESSTRPLGLEPRNWRGDMLVEFAEHHNFKILNTFFKKRLHRRWTWISPNGVTKNEIDYFLSDKSDIFTDVSVINQLNTGSDHRMVRSKIRINTRLERVEMVAKPKKIDGRNLHLHKTEFQLELKNKFEALDNVLAQDLDADADAIANIIHSTAISIAGRHKATKPDKLSEDTKQLMAKRRELKRKGTTRENIEYSETCKLIRRKLKEDIRKHDEKQIVETIENNRSLKTARRKQRLGTNQLISIKEEDGTLIHDQERIVERCTEFNEGLCKSRRQTQYNSAISTTTSFNCPIIMESEVEATIKRLDRKKAPGGGEAIVKILTKLFNRCLSNKSVPKAWKMQ